MGLHRKRNWKRKFSEMERVDLYLYAQGRCRKCKIELEKSCHGDLLSHIFYVTRVIGIEPTPSDSKSDALPSELHSHMLILYES